MSTNGLYRSGLGVFVGLFTVLALAGPARAGVFEDYLAETEDELSHVQFGSPHVPPIPPDFFNPGSQPFMGQVMLEGRPLSPTLSDASTIIRRPFAPFQPSDPPGGGPTLVQIEIVALNLVSIQPIQVMYPPPQMPELWDVQVTLSPTPAPMGNLAVIKQHPNGGVFDSVLFVRPLFVFTNISNPLDQRQLDAGGMSPIRLDSLGDSWVHHVNPDLNVFTQAGNLWVPGVVETIPGNMASQQEQIFDENSQDGGQSVRHWVCPAYRPPPPVEDYHAESDAGPTTVQFGTPLVPPVPADFFNPGSDPFFGQVEMVGSPIDPLTLGDASTIIRRTGQPVMPSDPSGTMGTVPIEIVALSLSSVNPIVVTYNGGTSSELWEVRVELSSTPAPPGQLTATKQHPNGGVFNTQLFVQPLFVFTRVSDLATRQLDTGLEGIPPLRLESQGDSFVHNVNPDLGVVVQPGNTFVPGILEVIPGDITSQQEQPADEESNDGGISVRHWVCPAYKRVCIYRVDCKDTPSKGACDNCPFTCGDVCRSNIFCVNTCPNYTALCPGTDCCLDLTVIECNVAPAGMPVCPPPGQPCTCDPQGGACCDANGNCNLVSDECACDAPGDRYIPGATTCGPVAACCFNDGTCQDMAATCCINRGGTPLPAGTSCGGAIEACCLGDGTCVMTDPACCQFLFLGTPQGPASACSPALRACCLPDGTCDLVDPICCDDMGGTLLPASASCDGTLQACCLPSGLCQDMDRDCCIQDGGTPQGTGTSCATTTCDPGIDCEPIDDGSGCVQGGCDCFGECINGSYCDDIGCCLNPTDFPNNCLCYAQHAMESIKLCGDCFGECIGGSYCDDPADPNCWINPGGAACYAPNTEVSIYLCKSCFGECLPSGSYCDGPDPDCCIGGPASCQCYPPTSSISLRMCPNVDRCEAKCVNYNPFTGQNTVTDCDCVGWHGCHVNLPGGTSGRGEVQRGTGNPCIVNDNGGGTVTLPPAGCEYLSPDDVHAIIDGLPAGTTIELGTIHKDFICNQPGTQNPVCSSQTLVDCKGPGGSLGGEMECSLSNLELNMTGTGTLAGFNRQIMLPIGFETHTAPRTPGNPIQSFDTDMFRLFGVISNIGDPDFDLLRITAGTDFNLPSPGHTTLTKLPGGPQWAVDSYFDISYRIDFAGAPGGPLAGMSGSTTGTIRMATGAGPDCVGQCPPGTDCEETRLVNADGTINICCNCVPVCEALPDGSGCTTTCPPPVGFEQCLPLTGGCNISQPGTCGILSCDCQDPNVCHLVKNTSGSGFHCEGGCPVPPGGTCTLQGDGAFDNPFRCNCVGDPPGACCTTGAAGNLCINTTQSQCLGTFLPGVTCSGIIVACCLPGGVCQDMDEVCCSAAGGSSIVGQSCTAPQACCFSSGACQFIDPVCCQAQSGTPAGAGTDCTDADGNGVSDDCERCEPTSDGTGCTNFCPPSPIQEECEQRCANYNPLTGQITITACDCRGGGQTCHLVYPGGAPARDDGIGVVAGGGPGCVEPDASGTVVLPPPGTGCPYVSPDNFHQIVAGLPAGTTVQVGIEHSRFLNITSQPGGSLGGEQEMFDSSLLLTMNGQCTGAPNPICGYNRVLSLNVACETHIGPRTPGQPTQSFPNAMHMLQGQINGDPDFDLLKITAGNGLGMPSPGHTTLTRLGPPGSNWAVDSYFDISYRIEYIGAATGPFAGRTGSTTGTIRMGTNPPFKCVGGCNNPRRICTPKARMLPDGTLTVCCDCRPKRPVADPTLFNKPRFVSFSLAPAAAAAVARGGDDINAIRVRLVSLHHVEPPYTGGPSIPFTAFEGEVRYAGPPAQYLESSSSGIIFNASQLQCAPHYQDWTPITLLHVTGSAITPSSVFEVEVLGSICAGTEEACDEVSDPLEITTTRWGDVEVAFNPPADTAQPDFADIFALVNKFKSQPGAPIKARALLAGDGFGVIDIVPDLSFAHIAACVDAFRGKPYPHTIATCP